MSCRSLGLACRKAANWPCGSTTHSTKSSYFRPSSFSTASLTPSRSLAMGKVSSPGRASPRGPAASKTSLTVPRATVGAIASETMPLRPQRGTDPYRANVIASITVDFPDPVGPTRAKKSASPKSTCASSLKEAKPCRSSMIGRIVFLPSSAGPGQPGTISVAAAGGGDLVVQLAEQGRDPRVADLPGGAVVGEQLPRCPGGAGLGGPWRLVRLGRELRVDAHLKGVGQDLDGVVAQPGAGRLAQVHPQVVVAVVAGLGLELRERAVHGPQPAPGGHRDVSDPGGNAGGGLDQADDAGVVLLAEVHGQRRAAVVHRGGRGPRLPPVQVAERHVERGDGEDGRGHAVLEDRLGGPLAAAEGAADAGEMRHDEVARVAAEAAGQRRDDLADLLVVGADVLRRGVRDDFRGAHRPPL